MSIPEILAQAYPVLPVLTIERREDALPLAEALQHGGIEVLEITLRTDCAADAIADVIKAFPALQIGAGSVCSAAQLRAAQDAGATFLVSPGFDEPLAELAQARGIALLPGVMTPSEMLRASRCGFDTLKLFPASVAGGIALLKAIHGPLAQLRFCPTGGITPGNYREYLALPNVLCIGGSWLAPPDLIAARDWDAITALTRALRE